MNGDSVDVKKLEASLVQKYDKQNVSVSSPMNCIPVKMNFKAENIAKVSGNLPASIYNATYNCSNQIFSSEN